MIYAGDIALEAKMTEELQQAVEMWTTNWQYMV